MFACRPTKIALTLVVSASSARIAFTRLASAAATRLSLSAFYLHTKHYCLQTCSQALASAVRTYSGVLMQPLALVLFSWSSHDHSTHGDEPVVLDLRTSWPR